MPREGSNVTRLPDSAFDDVLHQQTEFIKSVMQSVMYADASHWEMAEGLRAREARVYRRNIEAMAINAIRITYSSLPGLLGEYEFRRLVLAMLDICPPNTGDWGTWGRQLPHLLAGRTIARKYPFVVPMARLDWRRHRCARAVDNRLQQDTLALLEKRDIDSIFVKFAGHLSLLSSRYPLLELRTYQHEQEALASDFSVRNRPYRMAIYRPQFSIVDDYISEQDYQFTLGLMQGNSIGVMLDALSLQRFDLSQWLQHAIQHNWIRRLYVV